MFCSCLGSSEGYRICCNPSFVIGDEVTNKVDDVTVLGNIDHTMDVRPTMDQVEL